MTFPHFNRRLHLYLGLTLLPWFLMYGASSLPFAHNQYFEARDKAKGLPLWTTRMDRKYAIEVPAGSELRATGAKIMKDLGLKGAFGAYRQGPGQLNVYVYRFLHSTQVKYFVKEQRITVEDRRFRFDQFLTGMHARGGFEQEGFLDKAWGFAVDLSCLGMLLWIVSGVYMWWSLPGLRGWGWVAFLGGIGSYALFMAKL
jgi:hypothetical protein